MTTKITRLLLQNFRNFEYKKFSFNSNLIFLSGNNGIGKTNTLEAISLLGRNSSLRGDDLEEMVMQNSQNSANSFNIFAQLQNNDYIDNLAIKYDKNLRKKIYEFNGEVATSKRLIEFKNYLINFIFLTPQIEQLFIMGKSTRRDYLDKIVCDIDLSHQNRLNDYQKLLKERLLILQKYRNQNNGNKWLEIIEGKIAEIGIAIAFARVEAIDYFNKAIDSFNSNFPKTILVIRGEIEDLAINQKAIFIEDFYRQKLIENRQIDAENFRTEFGVHRADFDAIFCKKNCLATKSSTGEQKAIMTSITLARAKISSNYKNLATIIILDEVVSHLDDSRKSQLFDEINNIDLQCFFSATSQNLIPNNYQQNFEIIDLSI